MSSPDNHQEHHVAPLHNDNPFLLHSPHEIAFVLSNLARRRSAVTAYYSSEHDFTTVSVLHAEAGKVWLDLSQNQDANRELLLAPQIICVTNLDRVKVQFDCGTFAMDKFDGRPAFVVDQPEKLLKLQRRDYYRLDIPYSQTLKCTIPLPDRTTVEVEIMDISLGGIGIIGYPLELSLELNATYQNCAIHLPGAGIVITRLQICNSFEFTLRNGTKTHRSGCRFLNLQPAMEVLIQRYITQQEREYRLKQAERDE